MAVKRQRQDAKLPRGGALAVIVTRGAWQSICRVGSAQLVKHRFVEI